MCKQGKRKESIRVPIQHSSSLAVNKVASQILQAYRAKHRSPAGVPDCLKPVRGFSCFKSKVRRKGNLHLRVSLMSCPFRVAKRLLQILHACRLLRLLFRSTFNEPWKPRRLCGTVASFFGFLRDLPGANATPKLWRHHHCHISSLRWPTLKAPSKSHTCGLASSCKVVHTLLGELVLPFPVHLCHLITCHSGIFKASCRKTKVPSWKHALGCPFRHAASSLVASDWRKTATTARTSRNSGPSTVSVAFLQQPLAQEKP